jgi:hypothetical protein
MTDTRNPGDRQATVDKLGLTIKSQFVPFSQSRHAKEKFPSLNWKVTLLCNGREVLTTDYMAGSAHAPSYGHKDKPEQRHRVAFECEHGYRAQGVRWGSAPQAYGSHRDRIEPKALDVLHSLVMDSDVLDSGSFESWASDLGFDADSRKAESTYRACLDIALKLRAAIGDAGLTALREAFQDY